MSICVSLCPLVYIDVPMSISTSVHLLVHLYIYQYIHASIGTFIHPSVLYLVPSLAYKTVRLIERPAVI